MTVYLIGILVIFTIDLASKLDRCRTQNFTIDPKVMTVEAAVSAGVLLYTAVLMVRGAV